MRVFKVIILISLIIFCLSDIYSQQNLYDKVKIYIKQQSDIQQISELGIPLDGVYVKKYEYIIGEFSRQDIEKIKSAGFKIDVLIKDVSSYYEKRNKAYGDSVNHKKKLIKSVNCFSGKYPTPYYFSLGSMGGYFTYDEIVAQLDSMRLRFPNLVSVKHALNPNTIEGRIVWYVKISDNPDVDENEPKVLYSALTHAREPMGMQQMFFFMYYLLENYESNSEIKYLVDNLELYFIPCNNPDGYVLNQMTNPNGGGMHRKNCRQTGASNFGVDLNRNYGFMWGYDDVGSSPNIEAETYRGTAPFSEPETQAIKNFTETKQFSLTLDAHCYSNVLLYPWGYINAVTPDNSTFRAFSELMTDYNGFFYGTPMEGIGYTANGGSFDWYYGEQTTKPKIFAWSPEAGHPNDGFYPAPNRIETIARSFMEMNLYLARFALPYLDIKNSSRFVSNNAYISFSLYNVGTIVSPNYKLTLIPISYGLLPTSNQKIYNNLSFLQQFNDSFQVQILPDVSDGTVLKFQYKIETSVGVYYTDTFEVIKGTPQILFAETGNTMSNWTSNTWNVTSNEYHSPPKSITDSPNGNYPEGSTRIITQSQAISLANLLYAELTFWAKWDIETLADYLQLQISIDNGSTWQPLCGNYSSQSFISSTFGQPIYDGTRNKWVQERIVLNDYLGQSIKLRFKLNSGNSYTMQNDGFYFDDLYIYGISNNTNANLNDENSFAFDVYPNPSNGIIEISYNVSKNSVLRISSIIGQDIKSYKLYATNKQEKMSLCDIESGCYFVWIESENIKTKPKILLVK
jgi:hypothetical protein